MKVHNAFILSIVAPALLAACGQRIENLTQDDVPETAVAGLEEVNDALFDGGTDGTTASSDSALKLGFHDQSKIDASATLDLSLARSCDDSAAREARVTLEASGSFEASFTNAAGTTRAVSSALSGNEVRIWTPAQNASSVDCSSAHGWALIDWRDNQTVAGLQLDVNADRARSSSFEITRRGLKLSRESATQIKGSRHILFKSSTTANGELEITKEVSVDVERDRSIKTVAGKQISFNASVKSQADAPLDVSVVRDSLLPARILKKKIASGKVTIERGGNTIELELKDLVYDFSDGANRCVPKSGLINGTFLKAGANEALAFTIEFSEGQDPHLAFENQAQAEAQYELDLDPNCDDKAFVK